MISKDSLSLLDDILKYIPPNQEFNIPDAMNRYYSEADRDNFPLVFTEQDAVFQRMANEIGTFLFDYDFVLNKSNVLTRPERPAYLLTREGIALVQAGSYKGYVEHLGLKQETNQLKRLDWMLEFMAVHTVQGRYIESCWKEIKKLHPTIHVEYNDSYREQMIKKLVEDGYLEYDDGRCKITWKGTLFNNDGGYVEQYNRQNAEKTRLDKVEHATMINRRLTLWLTIVIAVGNIFSSMYYIQETKRLNWLYSFNVMVCLEVFLFGLMGGLMLYLIKEEIASRKR